MHLQAYELLRTFSFKFWFEAFSFNEKIGVLISLPIETMDEKRLEEPSFERRVSRVSILNGLTTSQWQSYAS